MWGAPCEARRANLTRFAPRLRSRTSLIYGDLSRVGRALSGSPREPHKVPGPRFSTRLFREGGDQCSREAARACLDVLRRGRRKREPDLVVAGAVHVEGAPDHKHQLLLERTREERDVVDAGRKRRPQEEAALRRGPAELIAELRSQGTLHDVALAAIQRAKRWRQPLERADRKSTRLNSSHSQ